MKPISDHVYIINPVKLYFVVWGFVCLVFESKFSYLLEGLHEDFAIFLLTTFFMFFLGWFIVYIFKFFIKNDRQYEWENEYSNKLYYYTKKALKIWLLIEMVQVIYSEGVPLLWLIVNNGKMYVDFGIHSINGFVNSLYLVIELNIAFLYTVTNKNKYLHIFLILLLWPVLIVTRQLLISALLEFLIIFFTYHKITKKMIIKTLSWFVIGILVFGFIGDIRTGKEHFAELAQPRYKILEELPSGILWVGIYVSTPVANLQNTFEYISPDDTYIHTFQKIIPSVLRTEIQGKYSLTSDLTGDVGLITPTFNVSSYMHQLLLDQGTWFVYVVTLVLGVIGGIIHFMAKNKKSYLYISANAIFSMMVLLSIFDNLFFFLPITFQFVNLWMFNKLMGIKNGN